MTKLKNQKRNSHLNLCLNLCLKLCLNWRWIETHGKSGRSRRTTILRRREPPITFAGMDGSSRYRCDFDLFACHSCLPGF